MNPSSKKLRLLSGQVIQAISYSLKNGSWGGIAEYLRLEFPPDQDIGQILVIYGSERDACYTDCESYLGRVAPPALVFALLSVFSRGISSSVSQG